MRDDRLWRRRRPQPGDRQVHVRPPQLGLVCTLSRCEADAEVELAWTTGTAEPERWTPYCRTHAYPHVPLPAREPGPSARTIPEWDDNQDPQLTLGDLPGW